MQRTIDRYYKKMIQEEVEDWLVKMIEEVAVSISGAKDFKRIHMRNTRAKAYSSSRECILVFR